VIEGARKAGVDALLGLAAAILLLPAPTVVAAEPDPAAWMYEPDSVVAIDLTLPQASVEALEAVPPTSVYQEATFSLAETDGTPGGIGELSAPLTVGIRIKGKAGSFRPLPQKSAFKLKFNSFVSGQKFLGLKKMTLNNMVQDPSMLHETLSYEAFRAMGVQGSRTGYAFVRLNGEPLGVYLNIEDLDDVGLEKRFGEFDDPQHLYEGEYGVDVRPEDVEDFEVDEGDDESLGDLEALAAAADDELAPDWSERLAPHADLDQMTRMWTVEKYTGHWDGYAGAPDDAEHDLPNNYYLFSDATGRFQMLPWGTDQTWEIPGPFDDPGGLLFNGCLADTSCAESYEAAAALALETIPALDFDTTARCTAGLLASWQALEEESVQPYDSAQIATAVHATREFIAARPGELGEWLGVEAPLAIAGPDPCPVAPPASRPEPALPTPADSAPPALRLERVRRAGGALILRFRVGTAGELSLRATTRTRKGPLSACAATVTAAGAGAVRVRCPLSAATLRRLQKRWLRLRLSAAFDSPPAPPAEVVAAVRLPRIAAS
jgi:hypothetical protein